MLSSRFILSAPGGTLVAALGGALFLVGLQFAYGGMKTPKPANKSGTL